MGRKEGFLERDLFGEKMEIGHEGDDTSAEEAVMESIARFFFLVGVGFLFSEKKSCFCNFPPKVVLYERRMKWIFFCDTRLHHNRWISDWAIL